ncbi:793_t:CDS:2 [Paraglomus occultum]|uniref:793_t:CDS:1 n=1 Tax=Paraglomus occultum TaxID=144539 RepID=A0A9N9B1P7_9GLOM|nr:793_t:CDS:2 [Paraglomus occultum]
MSKQQSSELPPPKSALDIAVSQLVRAAVGGIPSSIPDEDLNKYVADLILKEAEAKNLKYKKEGVRAFLPHTGLPPCNLPKTNKRFLVNIVQNVDSHNKRQLRDKVNSRSSSSNHKQSYRTRDRRDDRNRRRRPRSKSPERKRLHSRSSSEKSSHRKHSRSPSRSPCQSSDSSSQKKRQKKSDDIDEREIKFEKVREWDRPKLITGWDPEKERTLESSPR